MAVDNRRKRFSMMSMARPWMRTLPTPDGTISNMDRLQLAYRYASTLTEAAVGPYKDLYATFSRTKDLHATLE